MKSAQGPKLSGICYILPPPYWNIHRVRPFSLLMRELMKPQDVAKILQVAVSWVYQNQHSIPGRMKIGKYLRFKRAEIEKWLDGGYEQRA